MASNDVDFKGQEKGCGARMSRICNSIWDPQTKAFLGRTGSSWAKITFFYIVFYSCLAGFFAIMLAGFFATLSDRYPTMIGMYSLIKQNPGMGFRPMEDHEVTLIKFNTTHTDTYVPKIYDILDFLRVNNYIDAENKTISIGADGDGKPVFNISDNGVCSINLNSLNDSFGFSEGKPCVLLKINKVINWDPKPFTANDTSDQAKEARELLGDRMDPEYIGVTCEGENDGDIDSLGEVDFEPRKGFPVAFFPYVNAENYRAPLVFAQLSNIKYGVVMQVWCKLWAKDIIHHKNDKAGSVHFEVLVDSPKGKTRN